MRRKIIVLVSLLAGLTGCASKESLSSGRIGCPPNEVAVSDSHMGWAEETWTATCRGKKFYCTHSEIDGLSCSPELQ